MKDYEKAKKVNEKSFFIKFLSKENGEKINEKNIDNYIKKWEQLENFIKDKKYKKLRKDDKEILINFFNDNNNKDVLLKIFTEDEYERFINDNKESENDVNDDFPLEKNNELSEKISEIKGGDKETSTNNKTENKQELENDKKIEESKIINAKVDESNINDSQKIIDTSIYNGTLIYDSQNINNLHFLDESDYNLLTYEKIIGTHENSANYVLELKQGYFASGGDKNLLIYNEYFKNIMVINNKHIFSYISVIDTIEKTQRNINEIELIASQKNQLSLIIINKNSNEKKEYNFPNSVNLTLELKKNNYLILEEKSVSLGRDLFSKIISQKIGQLCKGAYKGAIKINENFVALTSNKILEKGKNILQIYNCNSQKLIKEIKGYSFIISTNGLALVPKEEIKEKNRILLCACKKYEKNQKNGILLVNAKFLRKIDIKNPFYDTGNFEVYCFCLYQ